MAKFLLLSTPLNTEAGPTNSSVLASFDNERHAVYAADIRNAKARRERNFQFYFSSMDYTLFWAMVPHHKGMEPR